MLMIISRVVIVKQFSPPYKISKADEKIILTKDLLTCYSRSLRYNVKYIYTYIYIYSTHRVDITDVHVQFAPTAAQELN